MGRGWLFMKTGILLSVLGLIVLLGLGAAAFWWLRQPQVITFSDDAKLTLLKVDYGKRHVPPPANTSTTRPGRRGGSFTTTNDTLVLWVHEQYDSQQWHQFNYYLYDKAGTACVGGNTHWGGRQGNQILGIEFDAFPHHAGRFYVSASENYNGGNETADKRFSVRNPAHGALHSLTASPLPDAQTDDDLSVTLTKLVAGVPSSTTRGDADGDDAINKAVQATFHVERDGKPVTDWQPASITTSDGTGNSVSTSLYSGNNNWINGSGNSDWENGDDVFTYQYGLWMDEPVWKLRVEFSQMSDFDDSELWTLSNVPLQPGNRNDFWNYNNNRRATTPYAETDLNGVHLKLLPPKYFTDAQANNNPQGGFILLATPQLPEGMRLTLVKVTDNQSNDIQHWENVWSPDGKTTMFQCQLNDIIGLTNINLSIAVHKSRFVEFTARPEKAPETASSTQNNQ
jgi:hypothetical protein